MAPTNLIPNRRKLGAGLAIVALLGAACGGDGDDDAGTSVGPATTESAPMTGMDMDDTDMEMGKAGDSPVATPAADLRAGLTSLLQEHVYLAGIAISGAVGAGGDMEDPAVVSAVETLDANSVALSEAIASVYGEDAGAQFLELWRNHIGMFVDYTLGGATGDAAMQEAALQELSDYRVDFGAFVDSATGGGLPADVVAENLQMHVDTLVVAIDAVLAGSPDVVPALRDAAQHMPTTAEALAGAIATQFPEQFPG
jgi:hypothetical protein